MMLYFLTVSLPGRDATLISKRGDSSHGEKSGEADWTAT